MKDLNMYTVYFPFYGEGRTTYQECTKLLFENWMEHAKRECELRGLILETTTGDIFGKYKYYEINGRVIGTIDYDWYKDKKYPKPEERTSSYGYID